MNPSMPSRSPSTDNASTLPWRSTLFDAAGQAGVRVPTSCVAQGKCKECIVEVTRRHGAAVAADASTSSISRAVPAVVPVPRSSATTATIECHTMRRGQMRIERHALNLPVSRGRRAARSGRHARRRRASSIDRRRRCSRESDGPIHGLAMDLGTTTVVLRLINLETGELVADASFENPQRFGGSDVMSRIHYDTEHRGKLLRRTLAGYLTHAIEEFPGRSADDLRSGRRRQLDDARPVLPAERLLDRAEPVPIDHRDRDGGRASATTTSLIETGRRCLLPIHPEGARLRTADHQRPRRRRRRGVHARDRSRRRRAARRDHGHRHEHRADPRQQAPHPRGVVPRRARRSRAARSPAACRGSTARSKTSALDDRRQRSRSA